MTKEYPKTWEEQKLIPNGEIFSDETTDDGVRVIVVQGPSHLCAYVGVPLSHPLANQDYTNLPLSCHGGLTFGHLGNGDPWPKGFFWYGWDYGHCGDDSYAGRVIAGERRWLVKDVIADSWSATYDFGQLMKLAESIAKKCLGWKRAIEQIEK
jgi:hypothetical protein